MEWRRVEEAVCENNWRARVFFFVQLCSVIFPKISGLSTGNEKTYVKNDKKKHIRARSRRFRKTFPRNR